MTICNFSHWTLKCLLRAWIKYGLYSFKSALSSVLFAVEVDGSNVTLTARCLPLSFLSGLIPTVARHGSINPTRNWVSHPGSRDVHMGRFHRLLVAAMSIGIHHRDHWLVVTMKVQIHHKEKLRWARSAKKQCGWNQAFEIYYGSIKVITASCVHILRFRLLCNSALLKSDFCHC